MPLSLKIKPANWRQWMKAKLKRSINMSLPFQTNDTRLKTVWAGMQKAFETQEIETANLDARLLLQHVLQIDHAALILQMDRVLTEQEISLLCPLIERRLKREPISRIFGKSEFWSLPFLINGQTLDPRPDTETLITAALKMIGPEKETPLRILDLGTGSGCILLSLLTELETATGVGVDLNPGAIELAQLNATNLGLENRSSFFVSNWFSEINEPFDLIVSNPPYIPSKDLSDLDKDVIDYDPMLALDGGATGLAPFEQIVGGVGDYISSPTWLLFECGAGQDAAIISLIEQSPIAKKISKWEVFPDLAGIIRVIGVEMKNFV